MQSTTNTAFCGARTAVGSSVGAHPWLDYGLAPVLVMRFPSAGTDVEVRAMYAAIEAFYAINTKPFVWVIDAMSLAQVLPSQRKIAAMHHARMSAYLAKYCRGSAFCAPSMVVRGFITAAFWLQTPAYEYTVVGGFETGMAWAWSKLSLGR